MVNGSEKIWKVELATRRIIAQEECLPFNLWMKLTVGRKRNQSLMCRSKQQWILNAKRYKRRRHILLEYVSQQHYRNHDLTEWRLRKVRKVKKERYDTMCVNIWSFSFHFVWWSTKTAVSNTWVTPKNGTAMTVNCIKTRIPNTKIENRKARAPPNPFNWEMPDGVRKKSRAAKPWRSNFYATNYPLSSSAGGPSHSPNHSLDRCTLLRATSWPVLWKYRL